MRCDESPVRLVLSAFSHPACQQFNLLRRKWLIRFGRRHQQLFLRRRQAFDQRAVFGIARFDDPQFDRALALVEPQASLSRLAIRAVASEAVLRQDRSNISVVLEWFRRATELGQRQRHRQSRHQR